MSRSSQQGSPKTPQATRQRLSKSPKDTQVDQLGFSDFGDDWIQNLVPVEGNAGNFETPLDGFTFPNHEEFWFNGQQLQHDAPLAPADGFDSKYLFSGIGMDAFAGLDDSTRRASMQLLTGGNAAVPGTYQDPYATSQYTVAYDPNSYRYHIPYSTEAYGYYQDLKPHEPTVADPYVLNAEFEQQQPSRRVESAKLSSRKRPRPPSNASDKFEERPRRRLRSSHGGSDRSSGSTSLPSYGSSRASGSEATDSTARKRNARSRKTPLAGYGQRPSAYADYKPERPKHDDQKAWIRTNNTTKGLTSRTGKINNYTAPYETQKHPIGNWSGKHHDFEYTENGEIEDLTMTASEVYDFIMNYPGDKKKGQRLIIWIQKMPTDSARRYLSSSWSSCRFAGCPNRNRNWSEKPHGSIIHGHYRVSFDEKWYMHGENSDPHLTSFYAHLYCMEKFMDFPFLIRSGNADVQVDVRSLPKEPRGRWSASLHDSPELPVAENFVQACKEKRLHELGEFFDYPRHNPNRVGEKQKKAFRKNTLTYWMNHYKRDSRPPAQFDQFAKRGFTPSNILVNNGDLRLFYWDVRRRIRQGKSSRQARRLANKEQRESNPADGSSMFPEKYRDSPEMVAIFNDLLPLYHRKMEERRRKAHGIISRPRRLVPRWNGHGNAGEDAGIDDNASEIDVPLYDPEALENNSDDDEALRGRRPGHTSEAQASRRSDRVRKAQAEGKLPQTYSELDSDAFLGTADPAYSQAGPFTDLDLDSLPYELQYQPAPDTLNAYDSAPRPGPLDLDAELAAALSGNIEDAIPVSDDFQLEFEAEWARMQEGGEEPDENALKGQLLRKHSTLDLPAGDWQRLASAILLSPKSSRSKSVSFSQSKNETQTFNKEQPPREVGRSLRNRPKSSSTTFAGAKKRYQKPLKHSKVKLARS